MRHTISRRGLLRKGAAVAAAGAALGVSGATTLGQAPAVVTGGRLFKAWISRGTGRNRTTLQDVRLRPVSGRQVVVRTEATNLCYSNSALVLGLQDPPPATAATTNTLAGGTTNMALIQGHGGVGVVEAVGPEVRRVQVGDRVCVSGTPQCGS
jgi:S-(hydroxymethyl)glutathione dehydrogenase/alcohol dehydrogenase